MENDKNKLRPTQKLDGKLETMEERVELVRKIVEETPQEQLTPTCLKVLTDYIFDKMTKKEKQEKTILTENHLKTVNLRETSFQGLVSKFENGEDGIYNLITNDKNIIFRHKITFTEEDIEKIPGLKELQKAIKEVEAAFEKATGRKKFLLKKQLIEMSQQQYTLRNSYYQPMYCQNLTKSISSLDLTEKITFDADGEPHSNALINLFEPNHISALLCNYSKITEDSWGKFNNDSWYLMEDLDNLIETTLKEKYPLYYDLVILKIDGMQNIDIQAELFKKHNVKHSVEYISSLWRNKIPKLLAEKAKEDYILWYYTYKEKGHWKKCSRCGQIKLAHNRFFSKNKTSKDNFYSICKECRNKK